jgi:hypothetical protein
MSAVIFDPAAAPTLEEYLQAVAGQPLDEQESLLKDPVTMEWLKEPCYAGVRLWELSEVTTLRNQAMLKGSTFWPHPLSRALTIQGAPEWNSFFSCTTIQGAPGQSSVFSCTRTAHNFYFFIIKSNIRIP